MAVHRGPASLRPRCIPGGSPVVAVPIYHLPIQPGTDRVKVFLIRHVIMPVPVPSMCFSRKRFMLSPISFSL
jgi:hypothetical protein